MESSRHIDGQVCRCVLVAGALALALIPVVSFADGARASGQVGLKPSSWPGQPAEQQPLPGNGQPEQVIGVS